MKIRIQFTPELTVALLCAAGWFALWLLTFRSVSPAPAAAEARPEFTRLVADDETLRKLKSPTLFALPSDEGFSGRFIEKRVDLRLTLEKPDSAIRYLPPESDAAARIDNTLLIPETALPQNGLPAPGAAPALPARPAAGIQLFLSPELEPRAGKMLQLNAVPSGRPETVRVHLTVQPDGTIGHAFFEIPVTNAALLSAVRQLRFKPAAQQTGGWVDICFPQEAEK